MLSLMHQVNVKKYAKSPPKKQLMHIMHEIELKKHYSGYRTWDLMVELLARWIVLNDKDSLKMGSQGFCLNFHGLPLKSDKELYEHIDKMGLFEHYVVAAKKNPWDHLGEVYCDYNLYRGNQGVVLTPKQIVDFMARMTLGDPGKMAEKFQMEMWVAALTKEYLASCYQQGRVPFHIHKIPMPMPKTALDPCVGSGRFLIGITTMYPKDPLVLYGIEIRQSLYRSCLVNMALFSNHPYTIICGDTLRLPQTCNCAHPIWDLGNRWKTPSLQKFYDWKPPKTSSLQRFMQMRAEESKT